MGRTPGLRVLWAAPLILLILVAPMPALGFELTGGVSAGIFQAGILPRLAVTPHVGISWRTESGVLFKLHDLFSVLSPINKAGLGVHNKTSITIGYTWEKADVSAGPSLSIYSMPACGITLLCGRIVGAAPGGHAQAEVYFAGPLGVAVTANVDWIGGSSAVLRDDVVAMAVAGPVLRWTSK